MLYTPDPAERHHLTRPSCPPLTNAPAVPVGAGLGRHATAHTSPDSWVVDTDARAARSHTLMLLSAELWGHVRDTIISQEGGTHPETARRPSGEISALRTQDEWPVSVATAPEPGLPEAVERTSCKTRRLSSDAVRSNCETSQLDRH